MKLIISEELSGKDVKTILKRHIGISTTLLNKLKQRENGILVNGERVYTNRIVSQGELLVVDLSDPPNPVPIKPVPMELSIVYEDEYLAVVNKPAPLAVHASSFAPNEPTLAGGLAARWGESMTFHPVNRLDRGTTGLMVVAKNAFLHERLQKLLHSDQFYRTYLGIAEGRVTPEEGIMDASIGRAEGSAIKRCIHPDGQYARTGYKVLETKNDCSLVRLTPYTGRTHQLRLHMASIGFPLVGDFLYGKEDRTRISRPALHAAAIDFVHPITGEELSLKAPLPEDMQALLR